MCCTGLLNYRSGTGPSCWENPLTAGKSQGPCADGRQRSRRRAPLNTHTLTLHGNTEGVDLLHVGLHQRAVGVCLIHDIRLCQVIKISCLIMFTCELRGYEEGAGAPIFVRTGGGAKLYRATINMLYNYSRPTIIPKK